MTIEKHPWPYKMPLDKNEIRLWNWNIHCDFMSNCNHVSCEKSYQFWFIQLSTKFVMSNKYIGNGNKFLTRTIITCSGIVELANDIFQKISLRKEIFITASYFICRLQLQLTRFPVSICNPLSVSIFPRNGISTST